MESRKEETNAGGWEYKTRSRDPSKSADPPFHPYPKLIRHMLKCWMPCWTFWKPKLVSGPERAWWESNRWWWIFREWRTENEPQMSPTQANPHAPRSLRYAPKAKQKRWCLSFSWFFFSCCIQSRTARNVTTFRIKWVALLPLSCTFAQSVVSDITQPFPSALKNSVLLTTNRLLAFKFWKFVRTVPLCIVVVKSEFWILPLPFLYASHADQPATAEYPACQTQCHHKTNQAQ